MKRALLACTLLAGLPGCNLSSGQSTLQTASTAVNAAVTEGQLYCAKVTATGSLVVAITDAVTNKPVSVIGQTAAFVQSLCDKINAIPVSPPAEPAQAPSVAVTVPVASGATTTQPAT